MRVLAGRGHSTFCVRFIPHHSIPWPVETFTKAKPMVPNPGYGSDRLAALEGLRAEIAKGSIDEPTLDIVERFARMTCVYTLQSCYGHFMAEPRVEDRNTRRVAEHAGAGNTLHYRIAYIAFCVEESRKGRAFLEELSAAPSVDPDYIQFGSADWFWNTCVNSYVLQVSPLKNAYEDSFRVSLEEAARIEQARDRFFERVREVLAGFEDQDG